MNQPMDEFLDRFVPEVTGIRPTSLQLERLAGDASDRRYYRISFSGSEGIGSLILMEILNLESSLCSEEVTLYHNVSGELPFLNIHRFMSSLGLPVPQIHVYKADQGFMLLEDLGDTLLWDAAFNAEPDPLRDLYKTAVEQLVKMQAGATEDAEHAQECFAFSQRFEQKLLMWEFDHFLEYGIEKKQGPIAPEDLTAVREAFLGICHELILLPFVFTHRDYHSRNLLVQNDVLKIIDFQDALLGPLTYDLASLLRDSYIALPEDLIDEMVDLYLLLSDTEFSGDPDAFRRAFDLTCIQRNLKAAGRFDYINTVKGNDRYLQYIPQTLGYVRRNLQKYSDLHGLLEQLGRYCGELR